MTGKKIEFSRKPIANNPDYIDAWVAGNVKNIEENKQHQKRTTIYLPEELHKKLKIKAVNSNTSMTTLIIEALEKHI